MKYRIIIPLIIFAAIVFCSVKIIWLKPFTVSQLYDRAMLKYALMDPQIMSTMAILDPYGLDFYNKHLTNPSLAQTYKTYNMVKWELKMLRSFDRTEQPEQERLSTDILDWYLSDILESEPFVLNGFPVNQYLGAQKALPKFMLTTHAINNEQDAIDYIERLKKFKDYFIKLIDLLKAKESMGYIPPRFVVEETIQEINIFIDSPVTSNVLYTGFSEKVKVLSLKSEDKLLLNANKAIDQYVYPGYMALRDYLRDLLPKTKDEAGVWHQPDGEAFYAQKVRTVTTLDMTPDEAYILLEKEVDLLNNELDAVVGQKTGNESIAAFKTQSLDDLQAILDESEGFMNLMVTKKPISKVQVRYSVANDTAICQYIPSNIGSMEPATIFVPRNFGSNPAFGIK